MLGVWFTLLKTPKSTRPGEPRKPNPVLFIPLYMETKKLRMKVAEKQQKSYREE